MNKTELRKLRKAALAEQDALHTEAARLTDLVGALDALLATETDQAPEAKVEPLVAVKPKRKGKAHVCPECGFAASGGTGLSSHLRGKHPDSLYGVVKGEAERVVTDATLIGAPSA